MTDDKGASLRETGSPPAGQAPAGLDAARFDPARMKQLQKDEEQILEALNFANQSDELSYVLYAQAFDVTATRAGALSIVNRELDKGASPEWAETTGSVAEGDSTRSRSDGPKGNDDE